MKRKDTKPNAKVFANRSIKSRLTLMKYSAARSIDQAIGSIQAAKVNQSSKSPLKLID